MHSASLPHTGANS